MVRKRAWTVAGILAVVAIVGFWISSQGSPFIFEAKVDLVRQRTFQSKIIHFTEFHWVCLLFQPADFQRMQPDELAAISDGIRYSIDGSPQLTVIPMTERFRGGNTFPNCLYLFGVRGSGDARLILDFSNVSLKATTLKVVVLETRGRSL
jgi:hypothetical protein